MTNLQDMQNHMKEMIIEVDKLFKENGIKYTLLGGSVLGAIRHKGFIPWDDDMDIAVWRKDYDKAEKLLSKLQGYVYHFSQERIKDVDVAPIGHLNFINEKYDFKFCPRIDIFALDKVPNTGIKRKILQIISYANHICKLRRPPQNRGKFNKIFFQFFFGITPNFLLDKIQKWTYDYILNLENKKYTKLGNIFGAYVSKEDFNAEIYENLTTAEFESLNLPIPKDYNFYLTQLYGDYMTLPPVEKQVPKHENDII